MSDMEQPDLIKEMGGIEAARAVVTGKASQDIFFDIGLKTFFQMDNHGEWKYWDAKKESWLICDPKSEDDLIDHSRLWVAICNYTRSLTLGSKVVAFKPMEAEIRTISLIYNDTGTAMLDDYYLVPLDQIRHPTEEELKLGKRSDTEP